MPGEGTTALSSPWDVAWWAADGRVWVAMAGLHQLWAFDPVSGEVEVVAGTANEGLLDGGPRDAWFAQPSGLAADGGRLWVADAETSALRYVEATTYRVHTVAGEGLFDFGFRDGGGDDARLQHPLGVAVAADGVLVADTYNGAVRRFRPGTGVLDTVQTGLAEPSGLVVGADVAWVVESAAHRLTPFPAGAAAPDTGEARSSTRPVTQVSPGAVELRVPFAPPPGQHVDERYGPATSLRVSATPPALLRAGDGDGSNLTRTLDIAPTVGDGVLHVTARAATCDDGGGEGAACRLHQQDWGIAVRVAADGQRTLVLPLGGVA